MKISVIIPAYNEEENLPRIISSLRKQTFKDFEIIVIDNNSRDNTFRVAKKLADKSYKCKEQGISPARNLGANKSKSDIIAFIDADAIASPKWLETINRAFENDKNLSAISGLDLYENDNWFKRAQLTLFTFSIFYAAKILNFFGNPVVIGNNMAIKKELFQKAGGFDKIIVEDYYFSKKLGKLKNIKTRIDRNMKIELSSRRMKKGGISKTILLWAVCMFKKIPSEKYILHDKL